MSNWYWAFWYALVFLTRLPTPYLQRTDAATAQRSLVFYPLVGLIIGGCLSAWMLVCWWYNPQAAPLLLAALTLALWIFLSGGLHLDGLADSADAWVGGLGDRDKTLAIMKDPHIGPIGTLTIVLVLLVQLAALFVLFSSDFLLWQRCAILMLVAALARASVLGLLFTTPYVRVQGLATGLSQGATAPRVLTWLTLLALATGLVVPHSAVLLLLLWLALNGLLRQLMVQRIGGYTGDTLGAAIAIQESLLLAALLL